MSPCLSGFALPSVISQSRAPRNSQSGTHWVTDIFPLSLHFPCFIIDSCQTTEVPYIRQTSFKTRGEKRLSTAFEGTERYTGRESEKVFLLVRLATHLAGWLLKQLEFPNVKSGLKMSWVRNTASSLKGKKKKLNTFSKLIVAKFLSLRLWNSMLQSAHLPGHDLLTVHKHI